MIGSIISLPNQQDLLKFTLVKSNTMKDICSSPKQFYIFFIRVVKLVFYQLDEIPQTFNVQLHNARDIEIGANPVAANAVNAQKSAYLHYISILPVG